MVAVLKSLTPGYKFQYHCHKISIAKCTRIGLKIVCRNIHPKQKTAGATPLHPAKGKSTKIKGQKALAIRKPTPLTAPPVTSP